MQKNIDKDKSKKFELPLYFLLPMICILVFDQITKLAVIQFIPFGKSSAEISVIDEFFYIVHVTNRGAAWGILDGKTYLLSSIAILTLAALWLFRRELGLGNKKMQFALGLFAGGVLGNLIDRIFYGHVVDFIDIYLPIINYRWPAFNIADCGISIGVTLYIIFTLFCSENCECKQIESNK